MSFWYHVIWRTATVGLVFLAAWSFLWGFYYEIFYWRKSLLDAFQSGWINWIVFFLAIVGVSVTSYIDDLVDKGVDDAA